MNCAAAESLVDGVLLAVALQAVSEKVGVLLVSLVGNTLHLALVRVRLVLLSGIDVLLVLHVFKGY